MIAAGDPGSSRLVYALVIGLVVVGVVLVLLGVWLIRQTRRDPEVLAPLERMGDADWARQDPVSQRRLLDSVRPEGARPLHTTTPPPRFDADFDTPPPLTSLEDLGPPVVEQQQAGFRTDPDPTPIERGPSALDIDIDTGDPAGDELPSK